jgi:DNA-binding MarR family transcriptional regulator
MDELTPCGDAFTELVLAVFRVNRLLLDAGDRLTSPVGLSSARWQVLGVVEHGPAPVAHVARTMGLTRQNVQQIADGLEQDGFIAYIANPHHRRAKLMAMTPKGDDALAYVRRRHAAWANQIGEGGSLEDLRTAVAVLRQIEDRLDRSNPPAEREG